MLPPSKFDQYWPDLWHHIAGDSPRDWIIVGLLAVAWALQPTQVLIHRAGSQHRASFSFYELQIQPINIYNSYIIYTISRVRQPVFADVSDTSQKHRTYYGNNSEATDLSKDSDSVPPRSSPLTERTVGWSRNYDGTHDESPTTASSERL